MNSEFLKIIKLDDLDYRELLEGGVSVSEETDALVEKILADIKEDGTDAIIGYISKFDSYSPQGLGQVKVSAKEVEEASQNIKNKYKGLVNALDFSTANITDFHQQQLKHETKSWFVNLSKGKRLGQIVNPIERVGIYVPGGRYSYPSSLLMSTIPAVVAGVKEIVVVTPPNERGKIDETTLFLCQKLGVSEIYKIGGAQAIGLLAYGAGTVKKVDKIVGPGNIYVTLAKKKVYGKVGIDSLAGPSEIVIIADESAKASYVAADLISQAEHDPNSRSILLSGREFAEQVSAEMAIQIEGLSEQYPDNGKVVLQSVSNNCMLIYDEDIYRLLEVANKIGAEHLEITCREQEKILKKVRNAGTIFIGNYTPVAVGDYTAGTNHVIPTSGNARFASPLGVYDFFKRSSVVYYSRTALAKEREALEKLAESERLYGHRNSIKIRFNKGKENEN
ncbi:MAG: histidinol dehydrogenase [Actinomycetota bacterium]